MNETSINKYETCKFTLALGSCLYGAERDQSGRVRPSLRGAWLHQGLRLWKALGLTLLLTGCGSSGDTSNGSGATEASNKPTAQSVESLSTTDCKDKPLVGEWRVTQPYSDVVTLTDSCLFTSYLCDTMGYVNSDISTEVGIASIVIVYTGSTDVRCPPPGGYKCAYDARQKYYKDLEIDCK